METRVELRLSFFDVIFYRNTSWIIRFMNFLLPYWCIDWFTRVSWTMGIIRVVCELSSVLSPALFSTLTKLEVSEFSSNSCSFCIMSLMAFSSSACDSFASSLWEPANPMRLMTEEAEDVSHLPQPCASLNYASIDSASFSALVKATTICSAVSLVSSLNIRSLSSSLLASVYSELEVYMDMTRNSLAA